MYSVFCGMRERTKLYCLFYTILSAREESMQYTFKKQIVLGLLKVVATIYNSFFFFFLSLLKDKNKKHNCKTIRLQQQKKIIIN